MSSSSTTAIILLNHNNFSTTKQCIATLNSQTNKNFHIYIIDNGSTDQVQLIKLRRFCQKNANTTAILLDDSYGFTKGNNIGIQQAIHDGYKYIWVLGNDTEVVSHALQTFIDTFKNHKLPQNTTILSSIITYFHSQKIWFNGLYDLPFFNFPKCYNKNQNALSVSQQTTNYLKQAPYSTGCSMFFHSDLIKHHGYMSEKYYFYFDDFSFSHRKQNYIIQQPLIKHKVSATLSTKQHPGFSPFQAFWYARGGIIYYFLDKKINFFSQIIYFFITQSVMIILYIRNIKSLVSFIAGSFSGLNRVFLSKEHHFEVRKPRFRIIDAN